MNLNYFSGQLKEFFFKIKSSQRHIGEFGELDWGRRNSEFFFFLQGCKSNPKILQD